MQLRENKELFWNLLYYFDLLKLPYALILPYFKELKNRQDSEKKLNELRRHMMNIDEEADEEEGEEEEKREKEISI